MDDDADRYHNVDKRRKEFARTPRLIEKVLHHFEEVDFPNSCAYLSFTQVVNYLSSSLVYKYCSISVMRTDFAA